MIRKRLGFFLGPFLFFIVFFLEPFEGLNAEANAVLASTLWIATWWLFETLHISSTALLPIVLLSLTKGAPIAQTTASYGDKMLFLFLGGFVLAIGMQKWNLHKRMALTIISKVRGNANGILLGFILATGLLSMWISNTAATLMMVTIAAALIKEIRELSGNRKFNFFKAILLGISFSASIGGVATLVGTPTNPIFAAIASKLYGHEFSFLTWMTFAMPFSLLMIGICWWILSHVIFTLKKENLPLGNEIIIQELKQLGKLTYEEKVVGVIFVSAALLWILRSLFLNQLIPGMNDTVIAIAAAATLFIIPAKADKSSTILTWEEAEQLPWGVIILFGGGLSLASAFQSSGLAEWIGNQLTAVAGLPILVIILIIAVSVNFLTEVTSNVATASIMMPVLASLANAIGIHPYLLMVPATMAASCAFMLPIATGPNAIAFSAGELEMKDMVKAGVWLNIISSLLISLLVYWLLPFFL
ncbi:MAG: DASS family sodium-coupled anion symporter [Ekhidna sp.]|nr:DASS family sodium-coupled anion symporter [Ekhidna sp.]